MPLGEMWSEIMVSTTPKKLLLGLHSSLSWCDSSRILVKADDREDLIIRRHGPGLFWPSNTLPTDSQFLNSRCGPACKPARDCGSLDRTLQNPETSSCQFGEPSGTIPLWLVSPKTNSPSPA
jgi:hypothetical protein